jgi:hypothetical protein
LQREQPKKTQLEEKGTSDRRLSSTFIPPLTHRGPPGIGQINNLFNDNYSSLQ